MPEEQLLIQEDRKNLDLVNVVLRHCVAVVNEEDELSAGLLQFCWF